MEITMENLYKLRIRFKKDVIFSDLQDEMIIMDMNSGRYFGLNETGAKIWSLLDKHDDLKKVVKNLCDEYEISKEKCEKEIIQFIKGLQQKELIHVEETD